jgi:4-hydroxy-2-oxoheptanedioate aldolase
MEDNVVIANDYFKYNDCDEGYSEPKRTSLSNESMFMNPLPNRNSAKRKLREGRCTVGTWLSLVSPIAARFLARQAFDWLTVDMEHSPVDWTDAAVMLSHIADVGGVPLVRVPAGRHDHIKRALDAGAFGVVVPMVMNRAEAMACIAACQYPPTGNRSVGGSLHALNFNQSPSEYYAKANDEILVVLQCEHIDAVDRADEIFSCPGIDAVFVGPNDLSASMRDRHGNPPTPESFELSLQRIREACDRHHVAAGIHCFSVREIQKRQAEGWRFLALGSDLSFMVQAIRQDLEQLGRTSNTSANY